MQIRSFNNVLSLAVDNFTDQQDVTIVPGEYFRAENSFSCLNQLQRNSFSDIVVLINLFPSKRKEPFSYLS